MMFALNSWNQTLLLNSKDRFDILNKLMNFREDIPCVGKEGVKSNNFHIFRFSDCFRRERNCLKGATNLDMILGLTQK
ncbi:MAG: hypothetical protein BA867_07555 [Desulfobacterales bacterium S5133MH16]|nr:MAG: hypothetical protein BA867_07555 [Desulfobacterales bacterium S5133MH16]